MDNTLNEWSEVMNQYEVLEMIGKGNFGQVIKAKHIELGTKVAIKRIDLTKIWHNSGFRSVIREVSLLRKLSKHKSNKFTVKLIDVILPKQKLSKKNGYLFLVMTHHSFSLSHLLKHDVSNFTNEHLLILIYNLICSFKYMHSLGVVHRDIKPSNILVNSDCTVKICDFGWARTLDSLAVIS